MSYEFYKVLHIIGLVAVGVSLGGAALHGMNGGTRATNKARALLAATHGVGLLLLLVAGFGMLAKLHIQGMPGWVVAKLLVWVTAAALLGVVFRVPTMSRAIWFLVPVLGGLGAWLAIYKPF